MTILLPQFQVQLHQLRAGHEFPYFIDNLRPIILNKPQPYTLFCSALFWVVENDFPLQQFPANSPMLRIDFEFKTKDLQVLLESADFLCLNGNRK